MAAGDARDLRLDVERAGIDRIELDRDDQRIEQPVAVVVAPRVAEVAQEDELLALNRLGASALVSTASKRAISTMSS